MSVCAQLIFSFLFSAGFQTFASATSGGVRRVFLSLVFSGTLLQTSQSMFSNPLMADNKDSSLHLVNFSTKSNLIIWIKVSTYGIEWEFQQRMHSNALA